MSYALQGVNFPSQQFTPVSDCALWKRCISDGRLYGCTISTSGTTLNVSAGWLMCGGRELRLPSAISVPVTGALSGKARLVVTVDLSQTSTEETFSCAWIDLEYEASYSTLTTDDLTSGSGKYQMVLVEVNISSGSISTVRNCGMAHGLAQGVSLSLPGGSGWTNNQCTVRLDGATPSNNILAAGAPSSLDAFRAADIRLVGQDWGAVTFSRASAYTGTVAVNCLIL
jgi:hypothetical protein